MLLITNGGQWDPAQFPASMQLAQQFLALWPPLVRDQLSGVVV